MSIVPLFPRATDQLDAREAYTISNDASVMKTVHNTRTRCLSIMFAPLCSVQLCCSAKEAGSCQQSHGFKICGVRVWQQGAEQVLDKATCKTRSKHMPELLASFAAGGGGERIQAVWRPVQVVLARILDWMHSTSPPCWHFYSASLLVVYEGMAQSSEGLRVSCSLIDFAHSFFVDGHDKNFEEGLQSLLTMLERVTREEAGPSAEFRD